MKTAPAFLALAFSVTLVLGATLKSIPPDFDPSQSETCIVLGRFEYAFNPGKPDDPHGKATNAMGNPQLKVKNLTTRKSFYIDLEGGRWDFYVALPPGDYEVTEWTSGSLTADPPASFDIPACRPVDGNPSETPACTARYIGTLKYARETGKGAFWKSAMTGAIPGTWEIVDEYEASLRSFQEKYPNLGCTLERSLLRLQQ